MYVKLATEKLTSDREVKVDLEDKGQLVPRETVPLRVGTDSGRVKLHPLPDEAPPHSPLAAQTHVWVGEGGT